MPLILKNAVRIADQNISSYVGSCYRIDKINCTTVVPVEGMYSEFQANILYSSSVIEPEDQLTFVFFGENVFVIDYVLARVNSFAGVKSADAYILTKLQYYDDWIMKEILFYICRMHYLARLIINMKLFV